MALHDESFNARKKYYWKLKWKLHSREFFFEKLQILEKLQRIIFETGVLHWYDVKIKTRLFDTFETIHLNTIVQGKPYKFDFSEDIQFPFLGGLKRFPLRASRQDK